MWYVIRVRTLLDGTIKKSEVMNYDDRIKAIAKFHSNMGTDMIDETLKGAMCSVLNQFGNVEISDYFEIEIPELKPITNEIEEPTV